MARATIGPELAGLLVLALTLGARGASAEQHGDGYGPRDADPREYGGGQGQYVPVAPYLAPVPYYGPAPYAYAPPPVPYAPPPVGYARPVYPPYAYTYAARPLPPLRPPPYGYAPAYGLPYGAGPYGGYGPGVP